MQKENQAFIIAIVIGSVFVVSFGIVCFLIVINYVRQRKKLLLEKELQELNFQQSLLKAQLEMQEHTFKAVSQEIHDNVGQILSLAKLNLTILTFQDQQNTTLNTVKELVTNSITELRDLGAGYHADKLVEEGLIAAIKHQINLLSKTGMFTTVFQSELKTVSIEKSRIVFLYRMVQEALNNIVKHACATHITLKIYNEGEDIIIEICDNGKGFLRTDADFKPGIGLNSIQQRASMIGAKVLINSEPGIGTQINFVFK